MQMVMGLLIRVLNVIGLMSNQVSVKKRSVVTVSSTLVNNAMEKVKHSVANDLPVLQRVNLLVPVSSVKSLVLLHFLILPQVMVMENLERKKILKLLLFLLPEHYQDNFSLSI